MLIYDVCSFPEGIDINVWYALYEKKLVIYDSKNGEIPFEIKAEGLSLIDFNTVSNEELSKVSEAVAGIRDEQLSLDNKEREIIKENNRKLIDYLKRINEENK